MILSSRVKKKEIKIDSFFFWNPILAEEIESHLDQLKKELQLRSLSYWSPANGKEPYQIAVPAEWLAKNKVCISSLSLSFSPSLCVYVCAYICVKEEGNAFSFTFFYFSMVK